MIAIASSSPAAAPTSGIEILTKRQQRTGNSSGRRKAFGEQESDYKQSSKHKQSLAAKAIGSSSLAAAPTSGVEILTKRQQRAGASSRERKAYGSRETRSTSKTELYCQLYGLTATVKMKLTKNSKLYITKGAALYLGSVIDTEFHKHHALQFTFGLKNDFEIIIEENSLVTKSILLNINCNHKLIGKDGVQALLLVEPDSAYGKIFRKYFGNELYKIFNFNSKIFESIESEIRKTLSIMNIVKIITSALNLKIDQHFSNDDRINKVINLIDTIDEKKITLKNLAHYVSLSESRLQHVFKKHTGISIKKYLQWKRLIDGINIIITGKDFTFSSHEAGFADSAHMSRTFKEMFGINLFDIFHNSRSIQVFLCNN